MELPRIELVEVSPRDGLQNEKTILSTADKVELIRRAIDAGARRLEVASFVHPERVPQMADAEAVIAAIEPMLAKRADVTTIGLVLNKRGALRALGTKVDQLGYVAVASNTFGQKNQGMDSATSVEVGRDILRLAYEQGRPAHAMIAVSLGCPFDGRIDPAKVVDMAKTLADAGSIEIGIADTIGIGTPGQVSDLIGRVIEAVKPLPVRVHFHDTRGMGVANVMAAIAEGAATVDASIAGAGGCPFAPGSAGNVASEDVAFALGERLVGIQLPKLIETAQWLNGRLGRTCESALMRASRAP